MLAKALLLLTVHIGSQAAVAIHLDPREWSPLFFNASHAAVWFARDRLIANYTVATH
jgi:hypothetical protein